MATSDGTFEIVVDAVGGRVARGPMTVTLTDGPPVRFAFGVAPHSGDRFHMALRVDKTATHDRRAPRWEPARQVAWIAESPAEPWTERVARAADRFRCVLTYDA